MADLGNIGCCYQMIDTGLPTPGRSIMPIWEGYSLSGTFVGDPRYAGRMPQDGTFSGTVKRDGVPLGNAWVHLFYRKTAYLVASTRSAADGTFVFNRALDKSKSHYFILAVDPINSYNIVVFDLLTPV